MVSESSPGTSASVSAPAERGGNDDDDDDDAESNGDARSAGSSDSECDATAASRAFISNADDAIWRSECVVSSPSDSCDCDCPPVVHSTESA